MTPSSYIERAALALEFLISRWRLIFLPLMVVTPLAVIATWLSPAQYTSTSLIMLRSAQQSSGWSSGGQFPQQSATDQVKAVETWLKSDPVLEELVAKLQDGKLPANRDDLLVQIRQLRAALKLTLVNNSVLEIQMEGPRPKGLGRQLEIVLAHLMEALLSPTNGLLSGGQLVLASHQDSVAEAEKALARAIKDAGIEPTSAVIRQLRYLDQQDVGRAGSATSPKTEVRPASAQVGGQFAPQAGDAASMDILRRALGNNPVVLNRLRELHAKLEVAQAAFEKAKGLTTSDNRYFGIFDAPEKLTVIGRPRDPLLGDKFARKLAIAAILLSFLLGVAIAFVVDFVDPRLRSREQFERLAGLPVVARLPKL